VNAPTLDVETIRKRARYYEAEGADIIDIGMLAGKPKPDVVESIVRAVRSEVNKPISIDTLEPSEIKSAIEAGVDLVLSIDRGNMEEVAPYVSNVPVVLLPSNIKEGVLPKGAEERVALLEENIRSAEALGIEKIIADLVLEPAVKPGLMESLRAYQIFQGMDEETPVLFGLGNVTELIDVDSTGVNGLLTALASEVGANLLFVPEYSPKARGSVREVAMASKMMFLAKRRDAPPKDLGMDLLVLKEKTWTELPYDSSIEKVVEVLDAPVEGEYVPDRTGWFKVQIDREKEMIVVTHFPKGQQAPDFIVRGRDVRDIYMTLIRRGLVSMLDHAAYLGRELNKAELALLLGRSYDQDESLF